VSQSPIYVYFDVDEPTMLRALRRMYSGDLPTVRSNQLPISIGLQDETDFPHSGTVDFANNVVDSSTGTILVRGVFANTPNKEDLRLMLPGMFVRVKLPLGKPHQAPLIAEKAVVNDQGDTFVYTVDEHDEVQYRRVQLGRTTDEGLQVVEEGLGPDDRVIVSGIQFAKQGQKAKVEERPMPTVPIDPAASTTPSTTSPKLPSSKENESGANSPQDANTKSE